MRWIGFPVRLVLALALGLILGVFYLGVVLFIPKKKFVESSEDVRDVWNWVVNGEKEWDSGYFGY